MRDDPGDVLAIFEREGQRDAHVERSGENPVGSREVLRLVMVGALGPALTGLGLGIVIALAGGRVVESVLYGVSSRDPWTLVVAPIVLLAIAVCAVWLPARRASRVDPAKVLRAR